MRLTGFTIVVALAFAGCSKPTSSETTPEPSSPAASPAQKSSEHTAAAPATKPSPSTGAPGTPAPQANPSNLAPEGVFYLVTAARIETSSGVQGLPPGTGVRRIRPGVYQTPVGELALADSQVTNDLSIARAARDAAVAEQAAATARQQAALRQPNTPPPKPVIPVVRSGAAPPAPAVPTTPNPGIGQATREIAALEQQFALLQRQYDALFVKKSKEDYNRAVKNRTVTTNTDQQLTQVQGQMDAIRSRIAAAQERLRQSQ